MDRLYACPAKGRTPAKCATQENSPNRGATQAGWTGRGKTPRTTETNYRDRTTLVIWTIALNVFPLKIAEISHFSHELFTQRKRSLPADQGEDPQDALAARERGAVAQ